MANSMVWGKTGHRVTGHVAEHHLSRKAKRAISELLEGHSLAFVSTYADEIKSDRSYSKFSPWHYVNYPLDSTYEAAEKSEFGDIVQGTETCIAVLKDPNSTREDKIFYLKMLVHFIGDLHQPMHVGRSEDRGGNDIQLQWFNQGTNLHRVWDSNLIDSYGMSYEELGNELIRSYKRSQVKALMQGQVLDWVEETHQITKVVYGSVKKGEKLRYEYSYQFNATVFDQLHKGGVRLAYLLNQIFD
jgi:hypothetical protein